MSNSRLGIAVKDGSKVYLENVKSISNVFDIALFNKKMEYKSPTLEIKNFFKENKKILQSKNSQLIIDKEMILGKHTNADIN